MPFSDQDRQKIVAAFEAKGVKLRCPMCNSAEWVLAENYTPLALQDMTTGLVIGGPSIPAIAVVCKTCGYISLHSSKVLVNLPEEGPKNE
jgi:predicted nucleic-acid-binding Zn-ribbon protein